MSFHSPAHLRKREVGGRNDGVPNSNCAKVSTPFEVSGNYGLGNCAGIAVFTGRDYMAVFRKEAEVAALKPNFDAVALLPVQAVVVTAPGDTCDFISHYSARQPESRRIR